MQNKTVIINGRSLVVRDGMRASEIKELAGIAPERVLIARKPSGELELVPDHRPLPGPQAIDAPRFIYG